MESIRLLVRGVFTEVRGVLRSHPFVAGALAFVVISGVAVHLALGLPAVRAAYETARLFFDSADTSVDERAAGAPALVVTLLWIDRFLAPAIVAGAVLEIVQRATRLGAVRPWWRNHVILIGAGSLGAALARHHLRKGDKVVVVDADTSGPNLEGLRSLGATVLEGDVRQRDTLVRARVDRARVVYALTDDDIANFSAALHAARIAGRHKLRVHARVEDAELRARLAPIVAARLPGQVLFDGFDLAARDLVEAPRIVKKAGPAAVVITGYGEFGAAVATALAARHPDHRELHVWLVDPRLGHDLHVSDAVAAWSDAHPGCLHVEAVSMLDRALWARIRAGISPDAHLDLVMCTDSDAKNVACALALEEVVNGHCKSVHVVVRMLEWSAAEAELLPHVTAVSIKDLLLQELVGR